MGLAKEKNAQGKLYDASTRFHVKIDVAQELSDDHRKVLTRLRSGTVIVYRGLEEAIATLNEFVEMARIVTVNNRYAIAGSVYIVDTRDGIGHNLIVF